MLCIRLWVTGYWLRLIEGIFLKVQWAQAPVTVNGLLITMGYRRILLWVTIDRRDTLSSSTLY